jgi:polysaccharide export outer membrane protein
MKLRVSHAIGVAFVVVCGSLWAQVQGAAQGNGNASNPAPAVAAATVQPGPSSTTKPHDNSFVIGNDDHLMIDVWNEPEVTRSVPVRSDGKISLPLAGELQAAGRTPLQLENDIAAKLLNYITKPVVTVIVEQINSEKFNILGQVAKPGSYPLTAATTVLDGIATAGAFRDFAKQKGIYILRQNPGGGESRIPFNYKEVIKGKNSAQNIKLQPNDTIVVP